MPGSLARYAPSRLVKTVEHSRVYGTDKHDARQHRRELLNQGHQRKWYAVFYECEGGQGAAVRYMYVLIRAIFASSNALPIRFSITADDGTFINVRSSDRIMSQQYLILFDVHCERSSQDHPSTITLMRTQTILRLLARRSATVPGRSH